MEKLRGTQSYPIHKDRPSLISHVTEGIHPFPKQQSHSETIFRVVNTCVYRRMNIQVGPIIYILLLFSLLYKSHVNTLYTKFLTFNTFGQILNLVIYGEVRYLTA